MNNWKLSNINLSFPRTRESTILAPRFRGDDIWNMKKIVIISVSFIVLAAIVVLVVFGLKKLQTKPANQPVVTNNPPTVATTQPPAAPPSNVAELAAANDLRVLVKKFSETYGSYSTDNNFANLESLKPLMTSNLTETVNKIIADGKQSKDFFGVTTRLIAQAIEESTDIRKVARAKTQRQETKVGAQPRIFYQDLVLTLVKTSHGWLVDQAKWQ